jgi:hypothetical protein
MNKSTISIVLALAVLPWVAGCGSSAQQPPPQAVVHKLGTPPPSPFGPNHVWTKEEKIAVIQKAQIPEDQKKAAIAKINSGG